ncbi:MAG: ATP-dependent DNA helicase RecG [Candidatus Protistobacter heckmanni]|nr:ATP-dependent DNA helicase RecG [Candidatus Protistobacter heckmanni]
MSAGQISQAEAQGPSLKPDRNPRKEAKADALVRSGRRTASGGLAPAAPEPGAKSAKPAKASGVSKTAADPSGTAARLAKLGLRSDIDLALHLPMRYEDETELHRIADLVPGVAGQVEAVVVSNEVMFRPRRQLVVRVEDGSGADLVLRFLNFYPNQTRQMAEGARLRIRGEPRDGFFGMEMVHPVCKAVAEGEPLPQALTPVYPSTAGISQAYLRKAVANALARQRLPELLEGGLLKALCAQIPGLPHAGKLAALPPLAESVRMLHQPAPDDDLYALAERIHPAWLRVKFEELLAQQLSLKRAQAQRNLLRAPRLGASARPVPGEPPPRTAGLLARFAQALPFKLTGAQERVWAEIRADLSKSQPMHRLLQGDVGSGKTIVAALAAAQALEACWQAALMAPTELLAEQHYRKLRGWLEPLGVDIVWLAGSLKAAEKRKAQAAVAEGGPKLVIGTHALIQDSVQFPRLGLAIVDEQHRFGVGQRLALRQADSQGFLPHQLMMSATPIPRTLAMTYYADLDVSAIDELPPGRTPVVTKLVSDARREEVIGRVRAAALSGRQAYWVCPLIEESEALQLQTAVDTHAALSEALPELQVGLVHGRLNAAEKLEVMHAFAAGEIHLLVATTVIEVGVDVPTASLMIIEHAERFGLAQLHQLRGRVGRDSAESACVLLYQGPLSPTAKLRLRTMRETQNGFEIAERDLEIRGPGEFLGARQSGAAMLRFADLQADAWMVDPAAALAERLLRDYPDAAQTHLDRWLGSRAEYLKA